MTKNTVVSERKSAYLAILFQAGVAAVVTFVVWMLYDPLAAKSALKGGLVAVIPNFVFAYLAFRYLASEHAERVKALMLGGHTIKIILTVVLCALVLSQSSLAPGFFIAGFVITLLTQWTAPFFFKH
ncbi:ATP synthase subunit I [Lacimicrobium alkaliphilum]|uniref:ATP synthase I n=1 Tax=Lacimicrobium alkaliphilum TaxID=1526571 RepID=A0A0U3B179_9ALTE|nr:ATP synthase subunit I [Lacimicrobium alkaliphilum]ALT00160.1 ATP synthase I [Lacimicrobium alkaliphilum]